MFSLFFNFPSREMDKIRMPGIDGCTAKRIWQASGNCILLEVLDSFLFHRIDNHYM